MKYTSAVAFRAALEAHLMALSRQTGLSPVWLRKAVVFDRLLARLIVVAPGRWVLKGALALDYRLGDRTRTTKDLDLGRQDDEHAATADFLAAQARDLGDYFVFAIERTARLDQLQEGATVRYHATCELAGRRFDDITVDVSFGDRPIGEPELINGPDLLAFADIEPAQVPAIPLAQHVAEKLHAYTRAYGRGGIPSTRVKDLIDLVLIRSHAHLDAAQLRSALSHTFASRGRGELPSKFPPPPPEWRVAYRRMASEVGVPADLDQGLAAVSALLDPILTGEVAGGTWDPEAGIWRSLPR